MIYAHWSCAELMECCAETTSHKRVETKSILPHGFATDFLTPIGPSSDRAGVIGHVFSFSQFWLRSDSPSAL